MKNSENYVHSDWNDVNYVTDENYVTDDHSHQTDFHLGLLS